MANALAFADDVTMEIEEQPNPMRDAQELPNRKSDALRDSTEADDQVSASDRAAAEAPVTVSRWAIHRRLYDWVLSFAHRPNATGALFVLSFAESSFFPIPPDVLLAPLCLGKRERSWWFATVCTVASVMGAMVGYYIGYAAWESMDEFLFAYVPGFSEEKFAKVEAWYETSGIWVLFVAAFTPIPFKVFTIAGGVFHQPLIPFILVSLVGRGARFFLVAGLFWWIGPKAVPFINRYFNLICIGVTLLLIGAVIVVRLLS